jgi:hypothetical protein
MFMIYGANENISVVDAEDPAIHNGKEPVFYSPETFEEYYV